MKCVTATPSHQPSLFSCVLWTIQGEWTGSLFQFTSIYFTFLKFRWQNEVSSDRIFCRSVLGVCLHFNSFIFNQQMLYLQVEGCGSGRWKQPDDIDDQTIHRSRHEELAVFHEWRVGHRQRILRSPSNHAGKNQHRYTGKVQRGEDRCGCVC